jgi:hypothetical protein
VTNINKALLTTALLLVTAPAYANCDNYTDGSTSTPAPKVTLCYKGKCDDTTLDYVCSSVGFGFQSGYANGLIIAGKTGKELEFTNKLDKKMNGKDWTCIDAGSNGCDGFERDWKVLDHFTGDETLAVDLHSEKDGHLTVMLDYGLFNGHSKGSMIADYEVKCAQGKFRVDASAEFSEAEGTGKVHVIHAHRTE